MSSFELTRGGPERHVEGSFDLYQYLGPVPCDQPVYVDLGDGNAVPVWGVRRDEDGDVILTVQKIDPNTLRKHG